MTLDPSNEPIGKLFGLLTTAIAPRPICFASTIDGEGNVNLSPFSFFNVFGANPITFAFSASRRVRDGSTKHTLDNVLEVPECVVNIIDYSVVEQMSLASTEYAKGVNEFEKAGLTQVAGELVKPPRVGEAFISFECVVDQVLPLGDGPGSGNLIIARAVRVHIKDEYLDADGKLDSSKLDMVSRMGGNDYLRAIPEAKFEIPKPVRSQGIGVDALPEAVRQSSVLTGNNLGRLGNLEGLPTAEEIAQAKATDGFVEARFAGKEAIHLLAKAQLEAGNVNLALATLVA